MFGVGDKFQIATKRKTVAAKRLPNQSRRSVQFSSDSSSINRQRLSKCKQSDQRSRKMSTLPPSPAVLPLHMAQDSMSDKINRFWRKFIHSDYLMIFNFMVKILAVLLYILRAVLDKSHTYGINDEEQCWNNGNGNGNESAGKSQRNLGLVHRARNLQRAGQRLFEFENVNHVQNWTTEGVFAYTNPNATVPELLKEAIFGKFEPIPNPNKTVPISKNWNGNTDFNYDVIFFICSPEIIYHWQVIFATFNFIYAMLRFTLLYKLDYKDHNITIFDLVKQRWMELCFELGTTVPFILSFLGVEDLRYMWVPVFLNIWLAREDLRDISKILSSNTEYENQIQSILFDIGSNILTSVLCMNHFERAGKYPDHFDLINSFWFVCVTFSTVGYGDVCPTTWASKIFVTIMMFKLYYNLTTLIGQYFTEKTLRGIFFVWVF